MTDCQTENADFAYCVLLPLPSVPQGDLLPTLRLDFHASLKRLVRGMR